MTQLIEKIFSDEITQQGLVKLQEQYPVDLKLDMNDEGTFKAARKTRTERNKLLDSINRRRLDVAGELKSYAGELAGQINNIYNVVVLPFESEDKRRKDEEAIKQKELEELLATESKKINEISSIVDDCRGKDSEHIQGMIEAVDLIETDIFHKDIIHQAIEVKKTTLSALAQLLADTIASEKVESEREELRKQKDEAEKKQRQAEKTQKIIDRITELKMIPTELFGRPSEFIQNKINNLEDYEISSDEFDEKTEEAIQAKAIVIKHLSQMVDNQIKIEAVEKAEEEKAAEQKATQAKENADREAKLAEDRAEQAEIESKERADAAAEQARKEEIKRQNDEKQEAEEAQRKLEADKKHVGAVRDEIKEHLMVSCNLDETLAKNVVLSLLKTDRVTFNY